MWPCFAQGYAGFKGGRWKAEGGRRKTEGGRRKTEGGRWKTEDGRQRAEGGGGIPSLGLTVRTSLLTFK